MFQDRRSQKNCFNDELICCLVVFQHDFHEQYFNRVKEELFLKDILCLKRRGCLRSCPLAQNFTWNKYYSVITKWINLNCPVVETSKSIEPSGNALGLNAIPLAFSKIFQPELKLFLWWSWTPCLHLFGPLRGEQGNWKKKHFLCRGRLHSLLMACRNTKTHREGETKGTNQQWSKAFVGKHCQNKTSKPD